MNECQIHKKPYLRNQEICEICIEEQNKIIDNGNNIFSYLTLTTIFDDNEDILSVSSSVEEEILISPSLITKSKVDIYKSYEKNKCSICLVKLKMFDIIRILDCDHYFHIECIDTWFTKNTKCPNCRLNLLNEKN
jgi:hypothetical protein